MALLLLWSTGCRSTRGLRQTVARWGRISLFKCQLSKTQGECEMPGHTSENNSGYNCSSKWNLFSKGKYLFSFGIKNTWEISVLGICKRDLWEVAIDWQVCVLTWAAVTKCHRLGDLSNKYFSQFLRLEVWDQGNRIVELCWSHTFWWTNGCLFAMSSHGWETALLLLYPLSREATLSWVLHLNGLI